MFNSRDDIKRNVINLLQNNNNSKIIFIVGNKGVGKGDCLTELSEDLSARERPLVIRISDNIEKEYIGVIYQYLKNNNSFEERKRFCNMLSNKLPVIKESFNRFDIENMIKNTINGYSGNDKKELLELLLFEVINNTPLVLFGKHEQTDLYYYKLLKNESLSNISITLIITIEANENSISFIEHLYHEEELQVFPFFLLPIITKGSRERYPLSISEIVVKIRNRNMFCYNVTEDPFAIEQYYNANLLANDLIEGSLNPKDLFIIAKQDLSLYTDDQLNRIIKILYSNKDNKYHNGTVIQIQAKYYLYDSILYYYILKNGIREYIKRVQKVFLDITNKSPSIIEKETQILFISFLSSLETKSQNIIASGMASYVSHFAAFSKLFFSKKRKAKRNPKINANINTEVLTRTLLYYSKELMRFLEHLYNNTQNNNILEIGLLSIKETNHLPILYDQNTEKYLNLCISAALKTNDITLVDSIKNTLIELLDKNIPFYIRNIDLLRSDKKGLVNPIIESISKKGFSIDKYIMKKTVFLSYNHQHIEIADSIDDNLELLGFKVIRDIKYLNPYDNIQFFMESSRNFDYSVVVISKGFLSSSHCMFELMNIFQRNDYKKSTFFVVIKQEYDKTNDDFFKRDYWNHVKAEWDRRSQENINITEYNTPEHYDNIRQYSATAEKMYSEFLLTQLISVVDLSISKAEKEQTITDISNNIKDRIISYDEFAV